MSWSPQNLYNLWRRSCTPFQEEAVFTQSSKTLFQQRWIAKRLTRAYHGDFINEKIFKRWYLPSTLPDVRPRKREEDIFLWKWTGQDRKASKELRSREEDEKLALAPVASLMFEEVERRIDVFIFRCCFAHSVYEARRLVIHGRVLVNGKKHQNANTRLAPGDIVSVDPKFIRFLQAPPSPPANEDKSEEGEAAEQSEVQTKPSTPSSLASPNLTPFNLPPFAAPFIFIPAYIEVSFLTCSAILVRRPTARYNYSEIPSPYDADGEIMRLSWEWYCRVRPRIRGSGEKRGRIGPDVRTETRKIPGIEGPQKPLSPSQIVGRSLRAQIQKNSVY